MDLGLDIPSLAKSVTIENAPTNENPFLYPAHILVCHLHDDVIERANDHHTCIAAKVNLISEFTYSHTTNITITIRLVRMK